jgi:hypothetical protein
MKPLVAQAATGALVGAVGLALALLPGRLLKPEGHARPLGLPQTQAVAPVEAVAPLVHRRRAAKPARHVVAQTGVAQLASLSAPVRIATPAPTSARPAAAQTRPVTRRPVRHAAPAPKRPVHHPRVFVEPARPTTPASTPTAAPAAPPAPSATAADATLTAPSADPTRSLASDTSSTTPTTTVPVEPPPPPTPTPGGGGKGGGDDDGHGRHHHHRG